MSKRVKLMMCTFLTMMFFAGTVLAEEKNAGVSGWLDDVKERLENRNSVPCASDNDIYQLSEQELVQKSVLLIQDYWEQEKNDDPFWADYSVIIDFKNARIVYIKDELDAQDIEYADKELGDVYCIVEFMMYLNYFSDLYPTYVGFGDSVTVYKDGKMEVPGRNLLDVIRARYYLIEYDEIIDHISDTGTEYLILENG